MLKRFVGLVVVVVLAGASWWGWMGWDDEYRTDPVTGVVSGPYEAWQVVGSGVCVVLLVGVATVLLGRGTAVLGTTLGYTFGWSVTSFPQDDSGLAGVGAVMVLVGVGLASLVVAMLTDAVARRAR